jgi:uncharacterized membrane protein YvlD (DUF360 family)
MRFVVRTLLTTIAFLWILPGMHGIHFHGGLLQALMLSLIFGIMLWLVEAIAVALSALVAVSSFGLALLWLIPFWILGFWFLPAVALMAVSDIMPEYLYITGWSSAIVGGLILLIISLATTKTFWQQTPRRPAI